MPRETNRYRLNYMQAYVKQYDDGSEILQSYTTDVVKKTPDGKYIRLWHAWSPSTNKQVNAYCNRRFRDIPYEDGTVEDCSIEYKRKGYALDGFPVSATPENCKRDAKEFITSLKAGLLYTDSGRYGYSTLLNKDLRKYYKSNKKMLKLINVLEACARKRSMRGKNPLNVLLKLYNYDFEQVWENSGLSSEYRLFAAPSLN